MAREYGIYPDMCVPRYWIGCRGIIAQNKLDIPWDRWSIDCCGIVMRRQDLIDFVNREAIPKLEKLAKQHETKGWFDSKDGKFRCEYDDRHSEGYLYCGFYNLTIEPEDECE